MKPIFSMLVVILFFGASVASGQENGKEPDPKTELEQARKKIKELEAEKNAEIAKRTLLENYFAESKKKQEEFHQKIIARVNEAADEATRLSRQNTDGFIKLVESVRLLNKELKDKQDELDTLNEDHEKRIRQLIAQIKTLEAEQKELLATGVGPDGRQPAGRFFFSA